MKNKSVYMGMVAILILAAVMFLMPMGCGDTGSSSSDNNWGGGGSSTSTYTCSGRITTSTGTAVPSASCTLNDSSRTEKYSYTVTTDSSGNYTFSNVPAGNYTMRVTATNYVSVNDNFSVSGNKTEDVTVVNQNDWNTFMGDANHPYDANSGYIQAQVYDYTSAGSSYMWAFTCSPNTYTALGYLNTNNVIDWTATGTYMAGVGFFYKVTPGSTYTVGCSKSGTTLTSQTCTVTAGEVTKVNFTNGSISSSSPCPTCTTTSQPTVQPTTCAK